MKKILVALLVLAGVLAAYLMFWPVPVQPVVWSAPADAGYTGVHTPNKLLAGLQVIALNGEEGPEHVALGPDGKLYAAVASGALLRMNPDGSGQEVFARTGGRVLGFDFDAAGRLIAADAIKGLLAIEPGAGPVGGPGGPVRRITVLADRVGSDPIRYADAVVVAKGSGRFYFSDASTRFGPADRGGTFEASILDIIEQRATGRVLEHDPATGATRIVAEGLSFANGVALSADEGALFVVETGRYRVWQIAVAAQRLNVATAASSPQARVLFDNLPGYPDNLMRGRDGRIWLGFAKPRNPTVDQMAGKPWLRELTLRLPRALWPVPKSYGHVMAFTEDGKVTAVLHDPSGAYPETTGVTETADRLYIHSLHAKGLGWRSR
ncbi:MAG: SMP-30/gluconolactonase/LRE family protein [Rubrivivax sp.]|nr:SMP-30/gluconolactonase/LRE family protein [Rubrivivax sp.]